MARKFRAVGSLQGQRLEQEERSQHQQRQYRKQRILELQAITPLLKTKGNISKWPDGYIVFDQGNFSDIRSLDNLLEKIISSNINNCITDDRIIRNS